MSYVISLDIGTTGCRSMVFTQDGAIIGESYIEYPLIVLSDRAIEQDANEWWRLSVKSMKEACAKACISGLEISGLCISSQGISLVPVDRDVNPLCNAISWLDTRAAAETDIIREKLGDREIFNITGKRINAAYTLPKLMWLKRNKPDVYERSCKFLLPHDFVAAKLTGEFATDHSLASGTMLYDLHSLCWSRSVLEAMEIEMSLLPELKWSGEPLGRICTKAAGETGLNPGLTVFTGGQDQKIAALGAGLGIGEATISLGTAGAIEFLLSEPFMDEDMLLPYFVYTERNKWVLEAVVLTAGESIKWARNNIFPGLEYREFDQLACRAPIGSGGLVFLPHLAGAGSPYWEQDIRGMFAGMSLKTSREDMARSVLESLAYQLKSNILRACRLGARVGSLKVFGGGSRSQILCSIIADVTGKRVTAYTSPEIASLGAALLAAKGCGFAGEEFGRGILADSSVFLPDSSSVEAYSKLYPKYIAFEEYIIKGYADKFDKQI